MCAALHSLLINMCTQTSPAFTGDPQQLQTHFDTTRVFNDGRQVALIGCIVISGEIGSLIKRVDLQVAAGSAQRACLAPVCPKTRRTHRMASWLKEHRCFERSTVAVDRGDMF